MIADMDHLARGQLVSRHDDPLGPNSTGAMTREVMPQGGRREEHLGADDPFTLQGPRP